MRKFKVDKQAYFDYRNPKQLIRHIDSFGRIEPASKTGLSSKQQRQLAVAIKRARHLGLIAFVAEG
ncbi:30S ribosomal protein S18 [Candidatus Saccharibacteria bacterium]|nr:30S ribosomal protein S18 [Candidatus Saccharibacteria bacterium]